MLACAFIKASLLLFYRRIFRGDKFFLVTAILLGVVCCWAVSFFFAVLLQCIPVSQVWLPPAQRTGHCYSDTALATKDAMATSNMYVRFALELLSTDCPGGAMIWLTIDRLLDIAILAVPQPIVWNLNMPLKRRIAVSLIFLLGSL